MPLSRLPPHSPMTARTGRRAVATAVLLATLAACGFAPLPTGNSDGGSGGASAPVSQAVPQSGADAPGTALTALDGGVCCVAHAGATPTSVNGISTVYDGWDTAFISWMVPHYAVAAQEAELAPTRAADAEVRALASKIDAAQGTTYLKMSAMARAWGQPVPSTDPAAASGHDHGGGSNSAATDAATLTRLKGSAFDRKFLSIAIADDQAAMAIAKASVANCSNPQARALAQEIQSSVAAEITQMQLLARKLS